MPLLLLLVVDRKHTLCLLGALQLLEEEVVFWPKVTHCGAVAPLGTPCGAKGGWAEGGHRGRQI